MALEAFTLVVHLDEIRIVVSALAGEDFPVVETDRIGVEVPLADHGGGVAGLAEEIGKGSLESVEVGRVVVDEPVQMGVFSSEDGGT